MRLAGRNNSKSTTLLLDKTAALSRTWVVQLLIDLPPPPSSQNNTCTYMYTRLPTHIFIFYMGRVTVMASYLSPLVIGFFYSYVEHPSSVLKSLWYIEVAVDILFDVLDSGSKMAVEESSL